jgi:hypothetical protein
MNNKGAGSLIRRRIVLRKDEVRLMGKPAGSKERHPETKTRGEFPYRFAQLPTSFEGWSWMTKRIDMNGKNGIGVESSHKCVHNIAKAVVDLHRIGSRNIKSGIRQILGALERYSAGDIEPPRKSAAVIERFRHLSDDKLGHQFQMKAIVMVSPEHDDQLRVKSTKFLDPLLVFAPETCVNCSILHRDEWDVRHAGHVGLVPIPLLNGHQ